MFSSLLSMHPLPLITLYSFFALFTFRHLLTKRKSSIFGYHIILFCTFFFTVVVGGSVQNDGYARLGKFIELEKNHKLNDAKQNPQNDDSMLAIDLHEFKNSDEFRAYLKKHDHDIDKSEAIFIGWLLVLLSDIAMMCVCILQYIATKIRNRFYLKRS